MFNKPSYFFEPLIENELDLYAHNGKEKETIKKIVFYHLLFAILSQTPENLRPAIVQEIKTHLYQFDLIERLVRVNPKINDELIERSISFILTQVQSRLENAAN